VSRLRGWHVPLVLGVLFFCAVWAINGLASSIMNNDVIVADAWLHGRAWVIEAGPWLDAMPLHGHFWVVEAPFPAVLMLPLVAVQGVAANQTLVDAIVAAIGVGVCYRLARRITGSGVAALAVTVFAAFGTSYFSCAADGSVWFFAHINAVTFTLLAVDELLGKQRGWLIGIWAAAAGLSRYPLLPVAALYVLWLLLEKRYRSAAMCALVGLLFAIPWAVYNEARWGTVLDPGFTIWYHVMDPRAKSGLPPFSPAYLQMQLNAFFQRPAHVIRRFPWITPPLLGFSLTWMSFALVGIVATLPHLRDRRVAALWLAMLLAAVPSFLYYDTGGVELGMRHALDFEPFAFALLAFALRTRVRVPLEVLLFANAVFGIDLAVIWFRAQSIITP